MIKLMADSTCDLADEVLEMYDISMAPLSINIEGKTYKDRVDIMPDEFYGMMEALSEFPTTGMPSPVEYLAIMKMRLRVDIRKFFVFVCLAGQVEPINLLSWRRDIFTRRILIPR